MEFSEQWMSLWTVSSVYSPPNLIVSTPAASSVSKSVLGPLVFAPSPTKFSEVLLVPTVPLLKSLPSNKNVLEIFRCSPDYLLFFPTWAASASENDSPNQLGFVKLCLENGSLVISGECITTMEHQFESGIQRISASPPIPVQGGGNKYYFLLLVSTLLSLHWYRVEAAGASTTYLGSHQFCHAIQHVCWSPHLRHECLVLLEFGELFLFELDEKKHNLKFPTALSSTKFVFNDPNKTRSGWLGCEFSWHPRIFLVASSSAVFLVDWRLEEEDDTKVCLLARMDMFHLNASPRTGTSFSFSAFCMAGSDGFHFVVASETRLFLVDIRKPLAPLLQWAHSLDNPDYIKVFKLSELRNTSKDMYEWASDSGFAILLGSHLDSKFKLFCYGPPLQATNGSVTCQMSKLCNSMFAWELPSEFSMLDHKCSCGNCLLSRETLLPRQKDERILGFGFVSEDLDSDGMSGFTLIRLVSSGMLVAQRYIASWDSTTCTAHEGEKENRESRLDFFFDHKYDFPRRFRYLKLESLVGFVDAYLPKVLRSKMENPSQPSEVMAYTRDSCKHVCHILSAWGADKIGGDNVVNGISWPMSLHEITSRGMWGSLDMELLQLAFIDNSRLKRVVVDHRKTSLDAFSFLQLSSFFLKKRKSEDEQQGEDDGLVGPVLPLPFLLTLGEQVNEKIEKGKGVEAQVSEIMATANDTKELKSSLLFHKPSTCCTPTVAYEDGMLDTLVSRTHQAPNKLVGSEFFDEMCPIELNFGGPGVSFETEEMNGYMVLKRELSRWQGSNKEYQDFLTSSQKIPKHAP